MGFSKSNISTKIQSFWNVLKKLFKCHFVTRELEQKRNDNFRKTQNSKGSPNIAALLLLEYRNQAYPALYCIIHVLDFTWNMWNISPHHNILR